MPHTELSLSVGGDLQGEKRGNGNEKEEIPYAKDE